MSSCRSCGRDLSGLPRDIKVCPYCGTPIEKENRCPRCGKDLSTFPGDITVCPYCSSPLKREKVVIEVGARKRRGMYILGGVLLLIPGTIMLFLIPPLSLLLFGVAAVLVVLGFRGVFEKLGEKL